MEIEKKAKKVEAKQEEGLITVSEKELAEMVEKQVSEKEAELVRRQKAFDMSGDDADEQEAAKAAKKLDVVKFIRALDGGDAKYLRQTHMARAKALNETTDSAGGYLVPEEFERTVNRFREGFAQIANASTEVRMSSNVKRLNEIATEPIVAKVSELGTITGTSLVFGEPVLTAEKYAAFVDWSSELEEDDETDIGIVNLIAERLARALNKAEQTSFVSSVVSGSEGILAVSGVTPLSLISGTTFSDITWDDLYAMMTALDEVDLEDGANASFLMSSSVFNALRTKKGTDGHYLVMGMPSKGVAPSIDGHDIILVNQMPKVSDTASATKFVAYADWKRHFFVGRRRGMTLKLLEEATVGSRNLAETDAKALRLTARTAQVTSLETGIVTLATN